MHFVRLPSMALIGFMSVQTAVFSDEMNSIVARISALPVDVDYGEYLAGECLTCHGVEENEAVPKIAGANKTHIITELIRFQNGSRDNPTMSSVAKALGEDEIASIAEYFSRLVD